jgi:predicted TIM-barrel fold metal-dependent hydrolase
MRSRSNSAEIRARLNHPIIDSDGHTVESGPLFVDYLKNVGGSAIAERYGTAKNDTFLNPRWRTWSVEERREHRTLRPTWGSVPARNTEDLATALFPRLMYERLEEMGLDFSVVYPTMGLFTTEMNDDEVRRASCRALNRMKADTFAGLEKRMTPAAVIPMHTPAEACDELEYCVRELGLRTVMMASYVKRPIPYVVKHHPEAAKYTYWMDTFGIDSEYDYDPVWARCRELGVSPTFHSVGYGWGARRSISNYIYNHIGNFAASGEALCKSLLLGGVPKRFPEVKFAFLEGGVAWARSLYSELIGHFEKRNGEAVQSFDPSSIDRAALHEYAVKWAGKIGEPREDQIVDAMVAASGIDRRFVDEWSASGVKSIEEIRDIFVHQFYFGCEGDDPLNALATNAMGTAFDAKLLMLYGSDIGHWDMPDMKKCAEEAYELVEDGLMTPEELRDFVFVNPVKFWTSTRSDFFKGTAVEGAVKNLLPP